MALVAIAGAVLLLAGLATLEYGIVNNEGTLNVPNSPSLSRIPDLCGMGDCVYPPAGTGGTITFSWSGATPQTTVNVLNLVGPCADGNGTGIAPVGTAGSVTFPIMAGHCYGVFQNGTADLTVSYKFSALSDVELVGIGLTGPGAFVCGWLALVGLLDYRAKRLERKVSKGL